MTTEVVSKALTVGHNSCFRGEQQISWEKEVLLFVLTKVSIFKGTACSWAKPLGYLLNKSRNRVHGTGKRCENPATSQFLLSVSSHWRSVDVIHVCINVL